MFMPHSVSETRNAYHAFIAALSVFKKYAAEHDMRTLVCPALCCGYGEMSHANSARQMHAALVDFLNDRIPEQIEHVSDNTLFITKNIDHTQPYNFDNREIIEIPLTHNFKWQNTREKKIS